MLSIIIVNYNVKYFIEQCLYSVQRAITGMDAEVIVVDNNSADGSVAYLQNKFAWIQFIVNEKNTGYARANNQGLQVAKGHYILFLNPDTILNEDCLKKSIELLEQHCLSGALGIRMIDGTGRFLPESKRGFPSAATSFFKLSGMIKIFPRSQMVARYYLGGLPEKQNNEIDVLAGAYMMIKKEALEKTGGFDEQFFMYGEDIDLSYRIIQAGYKNYYLGENTIVHFKGESTKKDIRYTRLFYSAMDIFVQKHYGRKSRMFPLFVQSAIVIRGVLAFTRQCFLQKIPARPKHTILHTILAGAPEETARAAEILTSYPEKRQLIYTPGVTDIYQLLNSARADEIVFCAGRLHYTDIIYCMEQVPANIEIKFFAAGSSSIVGSTSRNNKGETMHLQPARH